MSFFFVYQNRNGVIKKFMLCDWGGVGVSSIYIKMSTAYTLFQHVPISLLLTFDLIESQ